MEESSERKIPVLKIAIFSILALTSCLLWSRYISTKGLVIKEYKIEANNLDEHYDGLKIVHFSDLHYGTTILKKELTNLVESINKQKPDLVVFTGDLVDKDVKLSKKQYDDLKNGLKKINPSIEILSVIGNHDYYNDYYNKIVEELDWHNLDNTYEYVYSDSKKPIVFIGLDDLTKGNIDIDNAFSFLNEADDDKYTILLTHEPDVIDKLNDYDIDLALAGHSHLGQIRIPGLGAIYTPVGSKKYFDEHYLINNTNLYISGGLGTSTIKFRFLNKPSYNLYRFYTK